MEEKLARDIAERLERPVVALHTPMQARIVDGGADARGDQADQRAVVFGVRVDLGRLQIDHAHQFAPAPSSVRREFGTHRGPAYASSVDRCAQSPTNTGSLLWRGRTR